MRNKVDKKTVLLVFAQKEEYEPFFKNLQHTTITLSNGLELTKSKINNYTIYAFYSGVGKVAIAYKLGLFLSIITPDLIINIGVAGSISNNLKAFDILVATKSCYYDADLTECGYKLGNMSGMPLYFNCDEYFINNILKYATSEDNIKTGLILTGDSFITKKLVDKQWFKCFDNPLACDMESASVGQVAFMANVPYLVVRAISDEVIASKSNQDDYNNQLNEASEKAALLVRKVFETKNA